MEEDDPRSGGDPQGVAVCTRCESTYPVQRGSDGELRPIGTGGRCQCGSTEFTLVEPERPAPFED